VAATPVTSSTPTESQVKESLSLPHTLQTTKTGKVCDIDGITENLGDVHVPAQEEKQNEEGREASQDLPRPMSHLHM
jgi:hypothetical protein